MDAIIGAAGNILGGIFGSKGQKAANQTNLKIAREQMAFQERMSSTAHQREVEDLRKAGLNPILGYSKGSGGASTPQGASAQMQNENAILANGVMQAAQAYANIKLTNAQVAKLTAETSAMGVKSELGGVGQEVIKQFLGDKGNIMALAKEMGTTPQKIFGILKALMKHGSLIGNFEEFMSNAKDQARKRGITIKSNTTGRSNFFEWDDNLSEKRSGN